MDGEDLAVAEPEVRRFRALDWKDTRHYILDWKDAGNLTFSHPRTEGYQALYTRLEGHRKFDVCAP